MMFIDAHVHVVSFDIRQEFQRMGLSAIFDHCPPEQTRQAIESLLGDMDKADVDSSIAITSCALDIFNEYHKTRPQRIFIGYLYDSRNPKSGFRALRRTVDAYPHLVKCVKTMFPYLGQHPLQKEFAPLYRFCEQRSLPIQFHIGGDPNMENLSNPLYFGKLSSLFPKLSIVCLHGGGGMFQNLPLLMKLWPNIYLEVEALQLNEAEGSRQPHTLQYLLQHIDSSRLMFGSDRIFPEEKYFWRVQAARSLSSEQAEDVCWRTANRVFDLGLDRRRRPRAAAKTEKKVEKKKITTNKIK
ncbi:MAG: hypothetical protein C4520_02320 [Candidatus Abyssobacteria bacterium SURF_5]|uniref:Amidohydrolase-related domain-containing protein n=1 Tax=Abyssobacteria bacterium (strain SURF_5) TaxID=2093360 RepID=A0A3A4NYB0_ABYX5|nr:MAG: hypothetical protein C4520_02320 [Candidatus Abyssubacteria bacterium SURF_5]